MTILIVIVLLLALGVLGTVVKGLLWLTFVAILAGVIASIFGWSRLRGSRTS